MTRHGEELGRRPSASNHGPHAPSGRCEMHAEKSHDARDGVGRRRVLVGEIEPMPAARIGDLLGWRAEAARNPHQLRTLRRRHDPVCVAVYLQHGRQVFHLRHGPVRQAGIEHGQRGDPRIVARRLRRDEAAEREAEKADATVALRPRQRGADDRRHPARPAREPSRIVGAAALPRGRRRIERPRVRGGVVMHQPGIDAGRGQRLGGGAHSRAR